MGRHQVRHHLDRALVRHSRCGDRGAASEVSRRATTTTTKSIASATPVISGARRIRNDWARYSTAWCRRNVAWDPTLDIYEASRDLQRAQTQPWFAEYLHPTLEEYFRPNPANHGSYFLGWSSTDEMYWKENYRIWMAALREFDRRGGLIGMGDDAGFIYQMYGFGLIRSMELHQEAGFHPIKIIQQATGNNAKILGQEDKLGRVRAGFTADLIVVNGNPLENLKVLYPTGIEEIRDGKQVHGGGVEWTIKDGIPYHVPTLMAEVKEIVAKAWMPPATRCAAAPGRIVPVSRGRQLPAARPAPADPVYPEAEASREAPTPPAPPVRSEQARHRPRSGSRDADGRFHGRDRGRLRRAHQTPPDGRPFKGSRTSDCAEHACSRPRRSTSAER